jgi:hypothetical protein
MTEQQKIQAEIDHINAHWDQALTAICRGGIEPVVATDTMLAVAVSAKIAMEGKRRVSHELFMLAQSLNAQAEAAETTAKH